MSFTEDSSGLISAGRALRKAWLSHLAGCLLIRERWPLLCNQDQPHRVSSNRIASSPPPPWFPPSPYTVTETTELLIAPLPTALYFQLPKALFRVTPKRTSITPDTHTHVHTNKQKMKPYSTPPTPPIHPSECSYVHNCLQFPWVTPDILSYCTQRFPFWSPEGTSAIWLWLNVIIVLPSNWLVTVLCPWQNKRTRRPIHSWQTSPDVARWIKNC